MSIFTFKKLFQFFANVQDIDEQQHQAGTGFMLCLSDAIRELEKKGYDKNLAAKSDHFCCDCGDTKLYPQDVFIDEIIRFDNSSDPSDQAILYAISCDKKNLKGLYVESYGFYNEQLSLALIERIKYCRTHPKPAKKPLEQKPSVATRLREALDHW